MKLNPEGNKRPQNYMLLSDVSNGAYDTFSLCLGALNYILQYATFKLPASLMRTNIYGTR